MILGGLNLEWDGGCSKLLDVLLLWFGESLLFVLYEEVSLIC